MKLTVDSREKWTQEGNTDTHIKAYFEKNGIQFKVQKLDEGDYQIEGNPNITVDRKQNMQEMYNCVVNDKSRFMKEVRRCYEKHIKLYVLIEHGGKSKALRMCQTGNQSTAQSAVGRLRNGFIGCISATVLR